MDVVLNTPHFCCVNLRAGTRMRLLFQICKKRGTSHVCRKFRDGAGIFGESSWLRDNDKASALRVEGPRFSAWHLLLKRLSTVQTAVPVGPSEFRRIVEDGNVLRYLYTQSFPCGSTPSPSAFQLQSKPWVSKKRWGWGGSDRPSNVLSGLSLQSFLWFLFLKSISL